jgi:hypothetical protein
MASLTILYSIAGILICSIISKFLFWVPVRRKDVFTFFKSFFRWYGNVQYINAADGSRKIFMTASNIINVIWWLSLCAGVVAIMLLKAIAD